MKLNLTLANKPELEYSSSRANVAHRKDDPRLTVVVFRIPCSSTEQVIYLGDGVPTWSGVDYFKDNYVIEGHIEYSDMTLSGIVK